MRQITAVVPFRLGGLTRLDGVLTPPQREALAVAMLRDVVAVVQQAGLEPVVAAADQPTQDAVTGTLPAVTVEPDHPGSDLDASIGRHAAAHPDGLLVVMADLPSLQPDDIATLLAQDAAVVVAETEDGGTGALLRRPSDVIGTAYGPGSAQRHLDLAHGTGVSCRRVRVPGILFEIDRPEDLSLAAGRPLGPATTRILVGPGT